MTHSQGGLSDEERHQRTMNLNAHFAWALAMWGSADVAREQGNYMLAPIGFYYAAFHAGFAYLNSIKSIPFKTLSRMGHARWAKLLGKIIGEGQ